LTDIYFISMGSLSRLGYWMCVRGYDELVKNWWSNYPRKGCRLFPF